MKTQLITLVICFVSLFGIQAQDSPNRTSSAGIKGGYNLAAVSFDGEGETKQRHGFHIGIYGESFLNANISIQPELLYSQQGYEVRSGGGTYTQKLNYINMPLMFKAYPGESFFLEAGPQIGLAISHKEEFEGGFFDSTQEYDPSNFDWGMNFGAGFKTDSGVSLGARYHLGLGDIYDEGNPKNRVWQFYIGFDF
ncbi:outer membrane protein with beta-barrel domain [Flavobacteriaceae bacterium MAR_2010_105]|nr:outer membrane protein with beta-barrel domain [Flavobacteriaceae bacterium MAR_2010_105]